VHSSSGSSSPELLDPEDEGTTILKKVGNLKIFTKTAGKMSNLTI
jgi:hypothetical protein